MFTIVRYGVPRTQTEPYVPIANITNLRIRLSKRSLIGGEAGVSKEVTLGDGLSLTNEQLSVTSDIDFDAMVANSLF